jgi:DNA-binding transcriptional LysR family regulator
VKLAAIDLNLLVALDAIFSERNVTRAAAQIGRSQPATSHALNRARELFQDPLLVRLHGGLELTARARVIAPQIHRLLRELGAVFESNQDFDPKTLESVSIGATDYVGFLLLPHVLRLLRELAPGLSVRIRNLEGPDALEPLNAGLLDVALGTFPHVRAGLRGKVLFQDRFVCLQRKQARSRARMTPERFAQLGHVLVTSPAAGQGPVDYALAKHGLSRTIVAYVPHFLVAPSIVAATDLVLTTGERIARHFAPELGLETFPCPVPLDPFAVSMIWHPRTESDSAGVWLRGVIEEASHAHFHAQFARKAAPGAAKRQKSPAAPRRS